VDHSLEPGLRQGIEPDLTGLSRSYLFQVGFRHIHLNHQGLHIRDGDHRRLGIGRSRQGCNHIPDIGILGEHNGIKGSSDKGILQQDIRFGKGRLAGAERGLFGWWNFDDPEMPMPEEELETVLRIALEARRRVKEQQKRCLKTEFRNTHFSYFMGLDGVEQFVSTPELHSDEAIEADPLPPGQVWAISPGGQEAAPSLYRIEATSGPGGGVKILNAPVPPAFRESVRCGEQNLYSRAKELVGDRDPRSHEFTVQLRAMDTDRSGSAFGARAGLRGLPDLPHWQSLGPRQ